MTTSVPPDTAQAAYYYLYTGPQTLNYANSPCTQADTGVPNTNVVIPAVGGGNWTRVLVNASGSRGDR